MKSTELKEISVEKKYFHNCQGQDIRWMAKLSSINLRRLSKSAIMKEFLADQEYLKILPVIK